MKRFSRLICMMLAAVMLLAIPAAAAENAEPRASSFFGSTDVDLYKTSSTQLQAWFEVSALYTMDKVGASEVKIQESSDGENWTTVKTCTMANYSNLICENTGFHASYISYTGITGKYYRAKITLYAENSTGVGERIRYTSSILL